MLSDDRLRPDLPCDALADASAEALTQLTGHQHTGLAHMRLPHIAATHAYE